MKSRIAHALVLVLFSCLIATPQTANAGIKCKIKHTGYWCTDTSRWIGFCWWHADLSDCTISFPFQMSEIHQVTFRKGNDADSLLNNLGQKTLQVQAFDNHMLPDSPGYRSQTGDDGMKITFRRPIAVNERAYDPRFDVQFSTPLDPVNPAQVRATVQGVDGQEEEVELSYESPPAFTAHFTLADNSKMTFIDTRRLEAVENEAVKGWFQIEQEQERFRLLAMGLVTESGKRFALVENPLHYNPVSTRENVQPSFFEASYLDGGTCKTETLLQMMDDADEDSDVVLLRGEVNCELDDGGRPQSFSGKGAQFNLYKFRLNEGCMDPKQSRCYDLERLATLRLAAAATYSMGGE